MTKQESALGAFLRFFSSVKCGLFLLGLLGVSVVVGTVVVQRPMAREGQIEQLYAPQTIRLLDALGLLDVFHAWWFIILLGLLGACITLASIERFPQAWRYFSRPHMVADEWFVRRLPLCREIAVGSHSPDEVLPLAAAKAGNLGFRPHLEALQKGTLYIEKHRLARLAPYVVHLSLLIIFAGAMVDGVWGYRGYINFGPGQRTHEIQSLSSSAAPRSLPFTLRCDQAGMEKYPDGSPRQYWTVVTIEEGGREVLRKQISVNDPLTYKGIRFFQSDYGSTGVPRRLVLEAGWPGPGRQAETFELRPGRGVSIGNSGTHVELSDFVPDFVLRGNQISSRSNEPNNPAIQLLVTRPGGMRSSVWIFPKVPEMNTAEESGISFKLRDLEMEIMTGLQVAKEPGQMLIWGGCLLLTAGLVMALYLSHIRIWAVLGRDQNGKPVLVMGGQPSKYRESFERRFHELAQVLGETLRTSGTSVAELERVSA